MEVDVAGQIYWPIFFVNLYVLNIKYKFYVYCTDFMFIINFYYIQKKYWNKKLIKMRNL